MRTRRTLGAARPRAALNSSRIEIRPCFDQNKAVGTRRTLGAGVHARREAIAERGRDTAEIRRPGGPAGRASSHLRRGREGCGARGVGRRVSRRRTRGDGLAATACKDRLCLGRGDPWVRASSAAAPAAALRGEAWRRGPSVRDGSGRGIGKEPAEEPRREPAAGEDGREGSRGCGGSGGRVRKGGRGLWTRTSPLVRE